MSNFKRWFVKSFSYLSNKALPRLQSDRFGKLKTMPITVPGDSVNELTMSDAREEDAFVGVGATVSEQPTNHFVSNISRYLFNRSWILVIGHNERQGT